MQNFTVPKLLSYAIAITTVFFVTSCINSTDNSRPTQYQVGMEIQNIDSTFNVGSDTMNVKSVRFIVGTFTFETTDETVHLKDTTGVPLSFDSQATNFQNPAVISGGNFPVKPYESLNIAFPKAPENSSANIDPDFYGDGKRYSIIAEGTFNGSEFTYRSERVFENSFALNLPTIPEEDAFFIFLIQTNVRDWFLGGEGLLNPNNSENAPQINDKIEQSFRFEKDSNLGGQQPNN